MPFTEENLRLIVGLCASITLLVLIMMSELGHVPLEDRTVFLLGALILGGIGIDIWRGKQASSKWTDSRVDQSNTRYRDTPTTDDEADNDDT